MKMIISVCYSPQPAVIVSDPLPYKKFMSLPEINYCPSILRPGYHTYSPAAQSSLFGSRSKKVAHILPFAPPGKNDELTREYNEKRKRISISGVQEKYSLRLQKNNLILTD